MKLIVSPCIALLIMAAILTNGCSKKISNAPTRLSSYHSESSSGDQQLELTRESDAFIGSGTKDGRAYTIAAVVSWKAEGLMVFEDGSTEKITLQENPDGALILVNQDETTLMLKGSDSDVRKTPPGKFSGHYSASLEVPLTLDLRQLGDYINGVGRYGEETVAVAGKIDGEDSITATLYFNDDSTVGITATANASGDMIKVSGLGKVIKLQKRS